MGSESSTKEYRFKPNVELSFYYHFETFYGLIIMKKIYGLVILKQSTVLIKFFADVDHVLHRRRFFYRHG